MKRGLTFVITAGPTREHLDPVRFLSNPSTGKMGFAVARAAAERGHRVSLVAGPVLLKTPPGVSRADVVSAREMLAASRAALAASPDAAHTVFVATAAVADWRPAVRARRKLKKAQMSPTLALARNPDVLKTVRCRWKVGFAAETGDALAEARRKLREKGLSLVVANDVTRAGAGFGVSTNRVAFVRPDGSVARLPLLSKLAVARRIVRECERLTACGGTVRKI